MQIISDRENEICINVPPSVHQASSCRLAHSLHKDRENKHVIAGGLAKLPPILYM